MEKTKSIEKVEESKKSSDKKSSQKLNEVEKKDETWGIVSLVSGILSFLIPLIGLFLAIFAIIAYFMQKKVAESTFGLIGLILGIVSIILTIMGILIMIFFVAVMGTGMGMMF